VREHINQKAFDGRDPTG